MRYMEITEYYSGKRHLRKIKYSCSISYRVEGHYLVVRDYYTNARLQRFDVSKFGSISYRVIHKGNAWED